MPGSTEHHFNHKRSLTPSNEEKDPFPQLICRVGHHYSSVQVAAFHEHPEEVGHHKVIVDSGNTSTPGLEREQKRIF